MKKTIAIISLISLFCINAITENTIFEFGPDSENILIFACYRGKNNHETNSCLALRRLAEKVKDIPLRQKIMIAIIDNDRLDLPKFVPSNKFRNTKQIISIIHEYKNTGVFILEDGKDNSVKLTSGSNKKVCPSWMLEDVYTSLKKDKFKIKFKSVSILLQRLGLLDSDPLFSEYLNQSIPAIKIKTNKDINDTFISIIKKYKYGTPSKWDKHYVTQNFLGFTIISEKGLIILVLSILFFALFYVFMLTFLFEKQKEVHIKDLFKLWKMPILFFFVSIISFYFGEYFTKLIFYFRFSSIDGMLRLPITAVVLKFSFAFFICTLFFLLNKFTKLPQNTFIYGYLTTLVCLINVFIFSSYNLSFSFLFLGIYILAFISFQIKNTYSQISFFFLNIAWLLLYFHPIFSTSNKIILTLFSTNSFITACFFLPYELMIIRIITRVKRDHLRLKINKYTLAISLGITSLICILIILIAPTLLKEKTEYIVCDINSKTKPLIFKEELKDIKTDHFFKYSLTSKNYLERSICDIIVKPEIKPEIIQVTIFKEDGFPVYESNLEFETSTDGKSVSFLSPINTLKPFALKFSSTKNPNLKIKIAAWYEHAKTNIKISKDKLQNNKVLFKVEKELFLKTKKGSEE